MQTLDSLVRQEMTRKEFLAVVGFGAASLVGLSTFIQFVGKNSLSQQVTHRYGLGPYGGDRRRSSFVT
jgi:hypothetical protein